MGALGSRPAVDVLRHEGLQADYVNGAQLRGLGGSIVVAQQKPTTVRTSERTVEISHSKQVPWFRALIEGAVIVGSILLAFGIEAWWGEVQARAEEHEYLVSLAVDVEAVIEEAVRTEANNDALNEQALQRIAELREIQSVPDSLLAVSRVQMVITTILRARLDTYTELMSSGGVTKVRDPRVRQTLARLRSVMDFEEDMTGWTIDAMLSMGPSVLSTAASADPSLPKLLILAEEQGISLRQLHNVRKRDVLEAGGVAHEAIVDAIAASR